MAVVAPIRIGCWAKAADDPDTPRPRQRAIDQRCFMASTSETFPRRELTLLRRFVSIPNESTHLPIITHSLVYFEIFPILLLRGLCSNLQCHGAYDHSRV